MKRMESRRGKVRKLRVMKMKLAGILILMCLITGCSKEKETDVYYESPFGIEPEISYEVPISRPKAMVSLEGYDVKGKKTVTFYAQELSETFEIIDQNTKEVVYTGKIKKTEDSLHTNSKTGYGYFTEFEKTGTYYIRTDIIGQSYPFDIKENVKQTLFTEMNRTCYEEWTKNADKKETLLSMTTALLSFELYAKVYKDDLGVAESNNGIPDIIDAMKACINVWKLKTPEEYADAQTALTAAGIFAKFSNIYKQYDAVYANECVKAAEQIWNYYIKELPQNENSAYYAAAELYRAAGYARYHNFMKENQAKEDKFYGSMTYLSTRRKVDVSLCDDMMKHLMEEAEKVYQKKGEGIYIDTGEDPEAILSQMENLAVVDHIVTSHEYITMIENQLNYFLGCNPQGMNYKESWKSNSQFLFMLSAIMENKINREE